VLGKGYVQVYTGAGKGKTTAAFGLALRAAGHGLRTYIGQFMKGQMYGELQALRDHSLIEIEQYGDARCVRRDEVTPEHVAQARRGLERASEQMCSGRFDIVVLDEVNVTVWFGMLTSDEVLVFLEQRPAEVEVILTGRNASEEILARADLVTEMREVKHYFEQGILARDGIEK
jgi:cob(I)alamin adenosyltransferase